MLMLLICIHPLKFDTMNFFGLKIIIQKNIDVHHLL
jgi:hypothetical protein